MLLATLLDATIARLTRACSTDPGDAEAVDALERALLRAGRTVDAFLLRWRRGEPSPVAAELAAAQRPGLEALAERCPEVLCQCGERGCGGGGVDVAVEPVPAIGVRSIWPTLDEHRADPGDRPITALRVLQALQSDDLAEVARLPGLVHLDLRLGSGVVAGLAAVASLPVESLRLWAGHLRPAQLGLGGLPRLRELELQCGRLTDEGLEALVAECPRLETLSFDARWATEAGLASLARLRSLRRLRLDGTANLDGSFLRDLAESDVPLEALELHVDSLDERWSLAISDLQGLESLELHCGVVDPTSLQALGDLERLDSLELHGATVGPSHVASLEETRVRRLTLFGSGNEPACLEAVPALSGLESLRANLSAVPPASAIRGLGALPGLLELSLSPLDDGGMAALATLPALRSLVLARWQGGTDLGALRGLSTLEELDVSFRAMGSEALEAIVGLPRLRVLDLTGCGVPSLEMLSRAGSLRRLDVHGVRTNEGQDGLPELAASWLAIDPRRLVPRTIESLGRAPNLRTVVVEDPDAPTLARVRTALPWVEVRRPRPGEVA